jgi:hypothetical protein
VFVNGNPIPFQDGVTVAAALIKAGIWQFRRNPVSGEHRGAFCGMGICFECEVDVVGAGRRRACMVRATDQMAITTDAGLDPAPKLSTLDGLGGN